MVLYILTGYWELGILYLDQLTGACHTHTHILSQHQLKGLRPKRWKTELAHSTKTGAPPLGGQASIDLQSM